MSHCEGQFDDTDPTVASELTKEVRVPAPTDGQSAESDSMESEDEEWDSLYGDEDDICADFEEETRDFTKKLNAARGAGGLPLGQGNKKGAPGSALQVSKSIQV